MSTDKMITYKEMKIEEKKPCTTRKYSKKYKVWYITLYLAVLYQCIRCKADILETIEEIKNSKIINSKGEEISIYLNGIISPFSGFCHDQVGILRKLRLFWHARPIIDSENLQNSSTQYAINQHIDESEKCNVSTKDEDIKPPPNINTYLKEYEKAMHILFPSEDEYLSVYTKEKNSFYVFLNHPGMKDYKYKLLAALLVLSERAYVPLVIEKKESRKMIVLSSPNEKGEYFRIPVDANIESEASDSQDSSYYKLSVPKNAYQVIKFFIDSRTNRVIPKQNFVQARTTMDFETGRFAFGPGFLIQMFIYEYITSIDDLMLLAQELHVLLEQSLDTVISENNQNEEEAELLNKIFNKCFISRSKQLEGNGEEYIKRMFRLYRELNKNKILPFSGQWQLLPTTDPHIYNPNPLDLRSLSANALNLAIYKDTPIYCEEDYNYLPTFVNYMDTALLGLFCIFFYDKYKQAYILEKEPKYESKQLIEFFQKYKYMFKKATKAVHADWNRVVARLSDPNIRYIKPNRNQVDFGLMNMLSIIEHITGVSVPCVNTENTIEKLKGILDDGDKENQKYKEDLRNKNKDMSEEQIEEAIKNKYKQDKKDLTKSIRSHTEDLKKYIVELFNKLSVNKELEIEFTNEITADKTIADKWDIFVNIRIKVKVVGSFLYIYVDLSIMPNYTDFIIQNNESNFLTINTAQLSGEIRNSRNLLGEPISEQYICASYLFNNLYRSNRITGFISTFQELNACVASMNVEGMGKNCVSIAQLFISRKLDYNRERFTLARNLLFSAYSKQFDEDHYSLEVIHALFRSIDSEDEFTQKRILSIIKITNSHIIYPSICMGIDKEKLLNYSKIEYMDIEDILIFLATEKNPEKLWNIILNYLNMNNLHVIHFIDIIMNKLSKEVKLLIMRCLTDEYRTIEYIDKIIYVIEHINLSLYINFIFHLMGSAIFDDELDVDQYVKHLYDKLYVYAECYSNMHITLNYNLFSGISVIECLKKKKHIFCPNNSRREQHIFKCVIYMYGQILSDRIKSYMT
ncbi:hypothetical protein NEIG_01359 [Nematocida sp. ERTm5]|nr:hypothetical protein NEIG_01359 [Nematocida sp. ERTm5]